jgi:hypothetical protein
MLFDNENKENRKKIFYKEINVSKDISSNHLTLKLNQTVRSDQFSSSDFDQFKELEHVLNDYLIYKQEMNKIKPQDLEPLKYVINELKNEYWNKEIPQFHFELEEFNKSKKENLKNSSDHPKSLYQSRKKEMSRSRFCLNTDRKDYKVVQSKTKRINKKKYAPHWNLFKTPDHTNKVKSQLKPSNKENNLEISLFNEFYNQLEIEKNKMIDSKKQIYPLPGSSFPIFQTKINNSSKIKANREIQNFQKMFQKN